MKGIIKRLGGKSRSATKITEFFPSSPAIYCEPFVGGGSVFFSSGSKYAPTEIISDADDDIIDTYDDIQVIPSEVLTSWRFQPSAVEFKKLLVNDFFESVESRLFRNLYLSLFSYAGNRKSYCGDKSCLRVGDYLRLKSEHLKYVERLKDVKVICCDYLEIIKTYDSDHTFFYLDPPYNSNGKKNYRFDVDPNKMFLELSKIKGKFMVSYITTDYVKEICKKYCFNLKEIKTIYSGKNRTIPIIECLITNYAI